MQWKWSGAKGSGNMERASNKYISGGAKIKFFLVLIALALIGWSVAVFSAPYLRKSKFQHQMEDRMMDYAHTGYDDMIEQLIAEARKDGLPALQPESFEFSGGDLGEISTLRCKYQEAIKLPAGRFYVIDMTAEITAKIPVF